MRSDWARAAPAARARPAASRARRASGSLVDMRTLLREGPSSGLPPRQAIEISSVRCEENSQQDMQRLPPLNALKAFEAAARHLSFTAAATELHVTHGAVSRQIAGLEE